MTIAECKWEFILTKNTYLAVMGELSFMEIWEKIDCVLMEMFTKFMDMAVWTRSWSILIDFFLATIPFTSVLIYHWLDQNIVGKSSNCVLLKKISS